MRILHHLYQVGGSLSGLTHTSRRDLFDDANVYLLQVEEQLLLFDCGNGETLEQIFANIKYWGLSAEAITACFITHPHWDHAGAAHLLQRRGVRLFAHARTAEAMAAGDERCCGYLYHKSFTPCEINETVEDGQVVTIAATAIQAIHLPGHTMGCTAFAVELEGKRLVFSGDVIGTLGYGDFGWDGSIDFDKKNYLQSLLKFSRMDFDIMLPGHGLIYFDHPRIRVEECLNQALIQWR